MISFLGSQVSAESYFSALRLHSLALNSFFTSSTRRQQTSPLPTWSSGVAAFVFIFISTSNQPQQYGTCTLLVCCWASVVFRVSDWNERSSRAFVRDFSTGKLKISSIQNREWNMKRFCDRNAILSSPIFCINCSTFKIKEIIRLKIQYNPDWDFVLVSFQVNMWNKNDNIVQPSRPGKL